jgi:hypothetical protein
MSAWLLRKQNLLRHIAEEYGFSGSAARDVWFRSTDHRNFADSGCSRKTGSSCRNIVDFLEPRLHGAFTAAARAYLYSPHLIRRA